MTPILILKAFGHLPSTDLIESERERERREWVDPPTGAVKVGILHRAFEARAEVMGWAATSRSITLPRPLWNMFEAGLVDSEDDPSLIGWVYVGMANSIDLSKQPPAPQPGTGAGWAAIQMPPGYAESTVALPVALPQFVQCLDDATLDYGKNTERALHALMKEIATPKTSMHELHCVINQSIKKMGYRNLDFRGNLVLSQPNCWQDRDGAF